MKRGGADQQDDDSRPAKQGKGSGRSRYGPFAFKALCPEGLVAKMMANQGALIHQLESDSNSHLQFSPRHCYFPDTRFRILTVQAPESDAVYDALGLIVDQIISRADDERNDGKSGDLIDNEGRFLFRCALSKFTAGAIIGSKGERINALRSSSGAKINIDRDVVEEHQLVTIGGERDQLMSVLDELNQAVQADVEQPWFHPWAQQRTISSEGLNGAAVEDTRSSRPRRSGTRRSDEHRGCTIFVGHLPQSATVDSLRHHFQEFGEVSDADVRIDPKTGRSKGFGFITFCEPHGVERCLDPTAEHRIDGRWVDVKRYAEDGGDDFEANDEDYRHEYNGRRGHRDDYDDKGRGKGAAWDGNHLDWFNGLAEDMPEDYMNLEYCVTFCLPSAKCGAIIGRSGEHLTKVQHMTDAEITISKKEEAEGPNGQRTVTITGRLLCVYAAHLMLMRRYNDDEIEFQASRDRERDRREGNHPRQEAATIEALQRQIQELKNQVTKVQGAPAGSRGGPRGGGSGGGYSQRGRR